MKKLIYKALASYWSNKDGLVTIEWVGISAVVVVAAILITAAIMESVDGFAGAVISNIDSAATSIEPASGD